MLQKKKKIELLKATNERLNNEIERLQSDLEYQTESEKQNTADRVEDIKENIDQNTADINERYRGKKQSDTLDQGADRSD